METQNSEFKRRITAMHILIVSIISTAIFFIFLMSSNTAGFAGMYAGAATAFIMIGLSFASFIVLPVWWIIILSNKRGLSYLAFISYAIFSGPFILSSLMILYAKGGVRIEGYLVAKYLEFRPTPEYVTKRNIPDFVKEHDHLTIIGPRTSSQGYPKLVPALLLDTPLKTVTIQNSKNQNATRKIYWLVTGKACDQKSRRKNTSILSLEDFGYHDKCIRSEYGGPAKKTLSISSRRNQQKIIYDRTVFEDIQNGTVQRSAKWEMWHSKRSRPRKILGQKNDVISAIEAIYGINYETKVKPNPKILELTKAEALQQIKTSYSSTDITSPANHLLLVLTNWDDISTKYTFSTEEKTNIAARIYLTSMCKEARYLRNKKYLPMLNLSDSNQANAFYNVILDIAEQKDIAKTCTARPKFTGKDWQYKKFDYKISEEVLQKISFILNSQTSNWQKSIALDLLSRAEDLGQNDEVQNIIIDSIALKKLSPELRLNNFDNFIAKNNITISYELLKYITKITTQLTDEEFHSRSKNIGSIFRRKNRTSSRSGRKDYCGNIETLKPLNRAFMNQYTIHVNALRYSRGSKAYNIASKDLSKIKRTLNNAMDQCI